jgi:hypothetical protein
MLERWGDLIADQRVPVTQEDKFCRPTGTVWQLQVTILWTQNLLREWVLNVLNGRQL